MQIAKAVDARSCLLAEHAGIACADRDVAIEFESLGVEDLMNCLPPLAANQIGAIELARRLPSKQYRKLDELLSKELLCESLANDFLDFWGTTRSINDARLLKPSDDRRYLLS